MTYADLALRHRTVVNALVCALTLTSQADAWRALAALLWGAGR